MPSNQAIIDAERYRDSLFLRMIAADEEYLEAMGKSNQAECARLLRERESFHREYDAMTASLAPDVKAAESAMNHQASLAELPTILGRARATNADNAAAFAFEGSDLAADDFSPAIIAREVEEFQAKSKEAAGEQAYDGMRPRTRTIMGHSIPSLVEAFTTTADSNDAEITPMESAVTGPQPPSPDALFNQLYRGQPESLLTPEAIRGGPYTEAERRRQRQAIERQIEIDIAASRTLGAEADARARATRLQSPHCGHGMCVGFESCRHVVADSQNRQTGYVNENAWVEAELNRLNQDRIVPFPGTHTRTRPDPSINLNDLERVRQEVERLRQYPDVIAEPVDAGATPTTQPPTLRGRAQLQAIRRRMNRDGSPTLPAA